MWRDADRSTYRQVGNRLPRGLTDPEWGPLCLDTPWETRRTRTDLFVGRSSPTFGQGLRELADTLVAFITLACIPLAVRRLSRSSDF